MANGLFNQFVYRVSKQLVDFSAAGTSIRCMLLRNTGSYTFDPDDDFVSDVLVGGVEITVASYARKVLANKAIALDDANDRTKFDCDNIAFGSLESGQTVSAIVFFEFVTNDSDSVLIAHIDGKIDVVAAAPVSSPSTGSITGATQANPVVITSTGHGLSNGDKVKISSVGGMTEINDRVFTVAGSTSNTFQLSGEDGSSHTAYTSGGTWKKVMTCYVEPLLDDLPSGASVNFGGSTGTLNAAASEGDRSFEIVDLSGAITAGSTSSDVSTTLNLPAALGGGDFNVNINTDGLIHALLGN